MNILFCLLRSSYFYSERFTGFSLILITFFFPVYEITDFSYKSTYIVSNFHYPGDRAILLRNTLKTFVYNYITCV